MQFIHEISAYNHASLTDRDQRSIQDALGALKGGSLVSVSDAKRLFKKRFDIAITGSARNSIIATLLAEYGLMRRGQLEMQRDIAVCIELDDAGVNPAIATEEFRHTHWRQDFEPHIDRNYNGFEQFNFPHFVDACKASSVTSKIRGLLPKDTNESLGILLNPLPFIREDDQMQVLSWFGRFKTTRAIGEAYYLSEEVRQRLSKTSARTVRSFTVRTLLAPKSNRS